jgi:C-terminal peptidase prc
MLGRRMLLACLLNIVLLLQMATPAFAGDPLSTERSNFKAMLKNISSDIEKNYYDPTMKGVDWKAATDEARARIDNAKSVGDMMLAIYLLTYKLHDSHTLFLPLSRSVKLYYGFEAKPIGDDIRIYEIKKGDPAEKAGLQIGDQIVSVNGYRADRAMFDLMMMDMRAIRPRVAFDLEVKTGNEPVRKVHLEPRKKVEAKVLDFDRDSDLWNIITESENYEEEHKFKWQTYENGQIGYVWVRRFPSDSADFLRDLLDPVKNSKAVIVDLRSNPGGELECLKGFMGSFTSQETTVANLVGRKKTDPMTIKPHRPDLSDVPLYIIVDSETGSAAEIFARHFQRIGKAVVLGDKSSGRVEVSKLFSNELGAYTAIPYGAYISVARVVFPDNSELEAKGVSPDVMCIPTGDEMREGRDPCVGKALALARTKIGIAEEKEN